MKSINNRASRYIYLVVFYSREGLILFELDLDFFCFNDSQPRWTRRRTDKETLPRCSENTRQPLGDSRARARTYGFDVRWYSTSCHCDSYRETMGTKGRSSNRESVQESSPARPDARASPKEKGEGICKMKRLICFPRRAPEEKYGKKREREAERKRRERAWKGQNDAEKILLPSLSSPSSFFLFQLAQRVMFSFLPSSSSSCLFARSGKPMRKSDETWANPWSELGKWSWSTSSLATHFSHQQHALRSAFCWLRHRWKQERGWESERQPRGRVIVVPLNQTPFHCVFLSFSYLSRNQRGWGILLSVVRRRRSPKRRKWKAENRQRPLIRACVREQINIHD